MAKPVRRGLLRSALRQAREVCCAFAIAGLFAACMGGSGGGGPSASSPSQGIFVGVVKDPSGAPIAGARVLVDGVEGQSLTGADGRFVIVEPSLATTADDGETTATLLAAVTGPGGGPPGGTPPGRRIAALAPGFAPFVSSLPVGEGDVLGLDLVRKNLQLHVSVTRPRPDEVFVVDPSCPEATIDVEGFVSVRSEPGFRLDVVLVIDRSGSTGDPGFDLDDDGERESIFEGQIAAARCFLRGLDPGTTRVALVGVADGADVVMEFSDPRDVDETGLELVAGPDGGTNFEAALREAAALFAAQAVLDDDEDRGEPGAGPRPTPTRAVVFLTDGVPTIHGYPERTPFDPERPEATSNLTWHVSDSRAAVAAAQDLALASGAKLFGFSFIAPDDRNRQRKTLPHCVAETGGRYVDLRGVEELEAALCAESVSEDLDVEVGDISAGGPPAHAPVHSGGRFGTRVTLRIDTPAGELLPDGSERREIEIFVGAAAGLDLQVRSVVTVRVVSLADVESGQLDLDGLVRADTPVRDSTELRRPTGEPLGDQDLHDFLRAEFDDAVELPAVETFVTGGAADETTTLLVDFVYKEACFNSDFGFVVIDPRDPPASAEAALAGATSANILFHSGDVGTPSDGCAIESIEANVAAAYFEVEVPGDKVVAFFVLPNKTLAQYKQRPRDGRAPLFTIPALNPGEADQVLTFVSEAGRHGPGSPGNVLTAGPMVVFAFEDLAIVDGSDQDFSDIVFTVRGVTARPVDAGCSSQP